MSNSTPPLADLPETASGPELVLEKFVALSYAKANVWTGLVVTLYVLLFIVGVVAVFAARVTMGYPWIAVPFAMIAAGLGVDALRHHRDAEMLQRLFESCSQFGRPVSEAMLQEFRRKLPRKFSAEIDRLVQERAAVTSPIPVSAHASITVLSERAWFTHRLTAICSKKLEIVFWSALVISLGLLVYAGITLSSSPVGMGGAKCIAAVVLFALAGGVLRAWQGLDRFSGRSREIHDEAARWLKTTAPEADDAQRLWSEFQLARASAPLLPTLLEHFYQSRLDEEYLAFRAGGEKWRDSKSRRSYEPLDQT